MTRRSALAGLGLTAAIPLLRGTAAFAAGTELRVAWWGSDARHNATLAALDLYSASNPDVSISAEYGGYENYFERLRTQLAARKAPDLVQMSVDGFPALADKGALLDLKPLLEQGLLDLSDFDAGVLAQGERDGKLVTIPMGLTAPIVLIDESVLGEQGMSFDATSGWDGYAQLARDIAAATPDGYWGTADGGGYRGYLETWLRQGGSPFFNEEGQIGFAKEQLADFFAFWADLRDSGAAVPPGEQALFQENLDGLPIVRGIAALDSSFITIFGGLQSMTTATLGLGPMPYDDAANSGQSPTFGVSFSITSGTANPEATAALLQFLLHDPASIRSLAFTRSVTPSSAFNAIASEGMSEADMVTSGVAYIEALKAFAAPPAPALPPNGGEVQQKLLRRVNVEIAFGRVSISDGVDSFFDQAASIL